MRTFLKKSASVVGRNPKQIPLTSLDLQSWRQIFDSAPKTKQKNFFLVIIRQIGSVGKLFVWDPACRNKNWRFSNAHDFIKKMSMTLVR
jgi:hypothetical protein